jgi:hypothetical protein
MTHFTYVASKDGLTKIGATGFPAKREKQLKAKMLFALVGFNGQCVERALLVHFRDKRVKGYDWFNLGQEDIDSIRNIKFLEYRWKHGNPIWSMCSCHPYPKPKKSVGPFPIHMRFARPKVQS